MESAACHDGSRVSYLSVFPQPTLDFIKYKIVNLFLRNSGLFRNLERVVPAPDDAEFGERRQVPDDRCQFVRRAENISRTLDKQHWCTDVR
jgi:hypothetical protein